MTVTSNSPAQPVTVVNTTDQLAGIPSGSLATGDQAAVRQGDALPLMFTLNQESTTAVDNISVFYTSTSDPGRGGQGSGRWVLSTAMAALSPLSLIYQPGGPASGNIYNDPWKLAGAALAAQVPLDVYISCSFVSPAPWPVDIFLPNVRYHVDPVSSAPAVLQLVKGTNPTTGAPSDGKLWFPIELDAVSVTLGNSTPDVMVTVGEIFGQRFFMRNGASIVRPNDAAPHALFVVGPTSFELDIDNCLNPFANLADPAASNVSFFGARLTVLVSRTGPELHLPPFTGPAASTLELRYDASVPVSQVSPQPDWAGVFEPVAIDAAGGSLSSIIFRPGGVAGGNVLVDAASVSSALAACHGAAIVFIDDTLAAANMPAGVIWDFHGFGHIEGSSLTYPSLSVADGAQIRNLGESIVNCEVICKAHTLPTFDFSDWTNSPTISLTETGSIRFGSSTISPIAVPAGQTMYLLLNSTSRLFPLSGPVAFISLATGAGLSCFLYQVAGAGFSIPRNLLAGDGSTTLGYAGDSSAFPVPAWTLFTGTVTTQPFDTAIGTTYATGVAADWAGVAPTDVSSALDRIAAAVAGLLGHPIP